MDCDENVTAMIEHRVEPATAREKLERDWRVVGEPVQHVDATPDEGYVRRILEAHLYNNESCIVTDNCGGLSPTDPLLVLMNEASAERARLLRRAIARLFAAEILASEEKPTQREEQAAVELAQMANEDGFYDSPHPFATQSPNALSVEHSKPVAGETVAETKPTCTCGCPHADHVEQVATVRFANCITPDCPCTAYQQAYHGDDESAAALVAERFGRDAVFVEVDWGCIKFMFPGSTYPASWRGDDGEPWVAPQDRTAWDAWRAPADAKLAEFTPEEAEELARLQAYDRSCSEGDRPMSPSIKKLNRLMELEARERATRRSK